MKKILTSIFILSAILIFGQAPIVPKKMMFADMELTISNSGRAEIQKKVNSLHKSPTFFNDLLTLADLHFPIIEEEFAKKGFPDDIKYLCMQESGFRAEAVSSSNAVGYWQFKEATAIEQGLVVNRLIDERKNIVSSSQASSRYITAHNSKLDNWMYSIVAYQAGLGGVQKFYKKSYAGVKQVTITKDTHWYFLKFLAHKIAFQDFVGKSAPKKVLQVYYQTGGKSIKDFAHEHNMPVDDLAIYNKWINANKKIPSAERPYPVIVPISSDLYVDNETKKEEVKESIIKDESPIEKEKLEPVIVKVPVDLEKSTGENVKSSVNGVPAITATVGDNADKLAIKGGITRVKFLKYNEIKSFEKLVQGQVYFLKKKKGKSKGPSKHTTQHGESVWMISQRYGIKQAALRRKNRMSKYETTQPGRVLWLTEIRPEDSEIVYKAVAKPKEKVEPIVEEKEEVIKEEVIERIVEEVVDEGPQPKYWHEVQPQEDLGMIAYYYLVDKSQIIDWNNLASDSVKVGDRLKIMESTRDIIIIKDTSKIERIEVPEVIEEQEEVVVEKKDPILESKTDHGIVRPSRFINVWVEPGTTLYGLAKQHNVSVDDIKKYNKLDSNALNAGDKLAIPIYEEESKEQLSDRLYIVVAGDTFYSITRKLGVTVEAIKLKNKKTDNSLTVGEILKY